MTMPAMDRPSVAFAHFLDSMKIMDGPEDEGSMSGLFLCCTVCMTSICWVDDDDSLRTLLNTALAHMCP